MSEIEPFQVRAKRLLHGLAALIEQHERTGLTFEQILSPYLNYPDSRPARANARDRNGWLIPNDGTLAKQVYDLMKQGKRRIEIIRALSPGRAHSVNTAYYRIKNPDLFNATKRRNYKRRIHT